MNKKRGTSCYYNLGVYISCSAFLGLHPLAVSRKERKVGRTSHLLKL